MKYEELLQKVNAQYALNVAGDAARYQAPELLPCIESRQIKALIQVLADTWPVAQDPEPEKPFNE